MNIWYRSSASRRPPAEKKESNSTQYTYLTVYTSLNIYPIILSLSFAICFKLQHPYLSLFLLVFSSAYYTTHLQSRSIFSILGHPSSLLVYYCFFGVFLSHQTDILYSFPIRVNFFFHLKPSFFLVVLQMPLLRFSILLN